MLLLYFLTKAKLKCFFDITIYFIKYFVINIIFYAIDIKLLIFAAGYDLIYQ